MPTPIDLANLPSLLPLTTLTALLLTAEWSVDTPAARVSLTRAEALTPCPSIQFLEVSLTPSFLQANPFSNTVEEDEDPTDVPLYRAASNPPYLPHLRIITNTSATITPYEDSLDPHAIARFTASLCHKPFPDIASRDSISVSLRKGKRAAIIVDNQLLTTSSKLVLDTISNRPGWVIGFADANDRVFRERHHANPPAVVLVDRKRDAYDTVSLNHGRDVLLKAVKMFENRVKGRDGVNERKPVVTERLLTYFEQPLVWRRYVGNTTPIGLDAWMGVDNNNEDTTESFLWVFVTAPWCAFCQRATPDFEHFLRIVNRVPGVYGLIVNDTDALPSFLDRLVDGFPTVLMLRERDAWSAVQEYIGERSVRAMVDVHFGDVERAMRRFIAKVDG